MAIQKRLDQNGVLYLLSKLLLMFVRIEPGKGLSTNDLTDELKAMILTQFDGSWANLTGKPTNVSVFTNDADYQTALQVSQAISTALTASGFQTAAQVEAAINEALSTIDMDIFVPVEELPPAATANANKIYLVPDTDGDGLSQWMVANGSWKRVGGIEVSLEGYFNENNLVPITNAEIDQMIASLTP